MEQVRAAVDSRVRHVGLGVTGSFVALGVGAALGQGTCETYVHAVPGTSYTEKRVRGGTGDLQLRFADGSTLWCASRHCRPWQPFDDNGAADAANSQQPAASSQQQTQECSCDRSRLKLMARVMCLSRRWRHLSRSCQSRQSRK